MIVPAHKEALAFLSALFTPYTADEPLRVEIRPLHPAWKKDTLYPDGDAPFNWQSRAPYGAREWFCLTQRGIAAATRHALALAEHYEVYMGVLPRTGRTGTQADVPRACWLWCDVDGGTDGVDGAVRLVKASTLPTPQLVVVSGGGLHCYWQLAEPAALPDEAARKRFKELLKRLCLRIGGNSPGVHADCSRADTASILRVPGTFNHKHAAAPRAVRLLHQGDEESSLPLTWWRACLPALPAPPAPRSPTAYAAPLAQGEGLVRWAHTPFREGKRHKDFVGAAAWLIRTLEIDKALAEELLLIKARVSPGARPITDDEIRSIIAWA